MSFEWPQRLLGSNSLDDFYAKHWLKAPAVIRGEPGRFDDLGITTERFIELARSIRPDGSRLPLKAQFHHGSEHRDFPIQGEQIRNLYDAGLTTCLWELQDLSPELKRLTVGCKRGLQYPGKVYVNAYLSPAGGGFGVHFDRQNVIVIQLEGTKKWRFGANPAFPSPHFGAVGNREGMALVKQHFPWVEMDVPEESQLVEAELRPGDVFYMPPGTWHRPRAGEHSLALTLSFGPTDFQTMVGNALHRYGLEHADWREYMPPGLGKATPGAVPDHVRQFLVQRLADLKSYVNGLTVEDVAQLWSLSAGVGENVPAPAAEGLAIEPSTRLAHVAPFHWERGLDDDGADSLKVYWGKEGISLPLEVQRFLEGLQAHPSFVAQDAMRWDTSDEGLSWEEAKDALEALVSYGLISTRAG